MIDIVEVVIGVWDWVTVRCISNDVLTADIRSLSEADEYRTCNAIACVLENNKWLSRSFDYACIHKKESLMSDSRLRVNCYRVQMDDVVDI
jgi:hypothetical protein